MKLSADPRMVMTLDAGGTNFRFSAMKGYQAVTETVVMPSHGDHLERCLANLLAGFTAVRKQCPKPPVAISFAFPGPSDYPRGIIGDTPNLSAFRGGVALGPMLEDRFGIPVFVNNDGDLFAYGEAIAGFLPWVNSLLEAGGSPKRYKNLLGVTFGTGFGAGIVREDQLYLGDNSMAMEIWLMRNKLEPHYHLEEGVSIRGVRRWYAEGAGIAWEAAPEPKDISAIARGRKAGDRAAALEAFRRLGELAGDALGQVLTLLDSLVVIGGGMSASAPLFLPALLKELQSTYALPGGGTVRRLGQTVFNLDNAGERRKFVKGATREITVPGGTRKLKYDPLSRIGLGRSRLGTSEAVAIGAYAFALRALDKS